MTVDALNRSLKFQLADAAPQDIGRGIVRMPRTSMSALGLTSGSAVSIAGMKGPVFARVLASKSGRDELSIDEALRSVAGLARGDLASVSAARSHRAQRVKLVLSDESSSSILGLRKLFRQQLEDQPINVGQVVFVNLVGARKVSATVEGIAPQPEESAPIVDADTEVELKSQSKANSSDRVTYEDLGGVDQELARIREMIEAPIQYPDLFARLGIQPPRGVLLTGAPGTGKTLVARAVAEESGASFLHIAGPEIASKHFGESERQLREIFAKARSKAPSIVFIDEIDAIAPKRGSLSGEKQVERRMVAQLLTLLDGLEARGQVVVMAATNLPDSLDPALRRPGRFDREVRFRPPNRAAREQILSVHTRGMPLGVDVGLSHLAEKTSGFVGADLAALCREAGMHAFRRLMDLSAGNTDVDLSAACVENRDFERARSEIKPTAIREFMTERPNATLADVGGHEAAKTALRESILLPLQHRKLLEQSGLEPSKGVLLSGPPGTGKTLLAKAIAGEAEANFISVQGNQVASQFFGEAEKALSEVFEAARNSAPCIVFFDELDAVAPRRSASIAAADRIVGQLLTELDGMDARSGVIFLAATNRQETLDPAIIRPGRIDRLIEVDLPDLVEREVILKVLLQKIPLADDINIAEVAGAATEFSGADLAGLVRSARLRLLRTALTNVTGDEEPSAMVLQQGDLMEALYTALVERRA